MNKTTKIIIGVVAVIALIAVIAIAVVLNSKPKTNLDQINSVEDLSALVSKVYEGQENNLPRSLETHAVDVTDAASVQAFTGLENGNDLEYLVASEPMITSQAYSFVLAKVKAGVDANSVAKAMKEKVNTSKWICVTAEQLYATNSGDVVCLVMASKDNAKLVYDRFKTLAGNVGQEYEKTEEDGYLPPEMY